MNGPDFFIVGAPKCGTTAMTHYLDSHPDIFFPDDKEFHYFGSDIKYEDVFRNIRDRDEYFSQFEDAGEDQVVGETSTMNLYSERAAREIHDYDPGSKIIIMLRNPVDMMHSLHRHYLYGGNETIEDFEEALSAEPERKQGNRLPETMRFREGLYYRDVASYYKQVQSYYDVFERDQISVIVFDDFVNQTDVVYHETLEFLGVSTDHEPEFERINPSKQVLSQTLNRFVRKPPAPVEWMVQLLDQSLPAWMFRNPVRKLYRLLNTRQDDRDPMDPELRKELKKEFKPMVKNLESLIHRDLSNWYE
ncbi:MAG: sulfotransferase domain-containing protein [bacterium]